MPFFKFEENDNFISGKFVGHKLFKGGKFGEQNLPLIKREDNTVVMLPAHAILLNLCENLNVGDDVFIETSGERIQTKGGEAVVYTVTRIKK